MFQASPQPRAHLPFLVSCPHITAAAASPSSLSVLPPHPPPHFQTNHAASSATTPSTHAPALSNASAPALSVAMWMYNNPYFLPALRIAIEPLTFLFLTLGFKSWSCTGKPSSSHGNNFRGETTLKDCSPLITTHVPHASSPATSRKA